MSQNFDRRRFLAGALGVAAAAGIGSRTLHAGAAPAGQAGFSSTEIAPGVWRVEGAGTIVVSVVGPEGQVLVDNGETVVLGGIFTSTSKTDRTSVPFFGDVPYVGAMFRSRSVESTKKELLIFVTPKILKEGLAVSKR